MKLQINTKGSWRHVLKFDESRMAQVMQAVVLLSSGQPGLKWSVLERGEKRRWIQIDHAIGEACIVEPAQEDDDE